MKQYLLMMVVMFWVTACGDVPPVPTDHFYRLTMPQGMEKQQIPDGVIYVGDFNAEGLYNERPLLYINDQEGRELRQHHYHFWVTSPAHLLHDYLIDYLRSASTASVVMSGPSAEGGMKISGKVLEFEYQTTGNSTANVALELRLERHGEELPGILREYRVNEPINGDSMAEIIAAFNRATLSIYNQFVADIREL